MTAPLHARPFDIDSAKAGAPYCCKDGQEATILKWDGRFNGYPLIGVYGANDSQMTWSTWGNYGNNSRDGLDLVMLPLGFIDGKPVFHGDKLVRADGEMRTAQASWLNNAAYDFAAYTWPKPAPVYPETQMGSELLVSAYFGGGPVREDEEPAAWRRIANAALRHAIDNRQVVTKADYDASQRDGAKAEAVLEAAGWIMKDGEWWHAKRSHFYGTVEGFHIIGEKHDIEGVRALIEGRAERDLAVARAVREACRSEVDNPKHHINLNMIRAGIDDVDLAAIIANVKAGGV